MNQKNFIAIISVAAGLIILVAIFLSQRPEEVEIRSTDTNVAEEQQSSGDSSQGSTRVFTKRDVDILNDGIDEEGQKAREEQSDLMADVGDPLDSDFLLDPETVDRLLEEHGSVLALYKTLDEKQRKDFINYLFLKNELRGNLSELLAYEEDSDMRGLMLLKIAPDVQIPENPDEIFDTVDRDLVAILDNATPTDIESGEWIARMHLSSLTDQEYAMNWVRDAAITHPDDQHVNFVASTLTMKIGASIENVTGSEKVDAARFIQNKLLGDSSDEISPDDRTSAYYGLYWSDDKQQVLQFYRDRLSMETDPNARNTLEGLISRVESRL